MSFFFLFYNQGSIQGASGTGGAGTPTAFSFAGVAGTGNATPLGIAIALLAASVSGTGQTSSLGIEDDIGAAGVAISGQIGSAGIKIDAAIAGAAGVGQFGSPSIEVDETPSLVGVGASGQAGSSSIEVDASASGVAAIGQIASLASKIDSTGGGTVCTGQVGSPGIEVDASVAGAVGIGQAGSPSIEVDETASIAGVVANGQIGSPQLELDAPVIGRAGTSQVGSPAIEMDASAAGVGSSGQVGSVVTAINVSGVGVVAAGQVGSLTIEVDQAASIAGVGGTGQIGVVLSETDASGVGVTSIGQSGSPTVEIDRSLAGSAASGQAGAFVIERDQTVALVGVAGTSQIGVILAETNVSGIGVGGSGQSGSPSIEVDETATIVGGAGTGAAGSPVAGQGFNVLIAGSSAAGEVGSSTVEVDASVLGVEAEGSAGDAIVGDQIVVSQYSDDDGAPGDFITVIGTFYDAVVGPTPTIVSLTPDIPIALAANTRYWVQVTNTNTTAVAWVTLDNDGGTGVAPEFWVKSDGPSGANDSGLAYQMAIIVEETIGISGVSGGGQAGIPGLTLPGVEATGSAGVTDIAIGAIDQITVSLYSDNDGVPGDFIEVIGTFYDAAVSTAPTTITLEPNNPIALEPNTRYWVQVTNSLTTSVRWVNLDNDSGTGVAPEFWYKSTGDSGANDSSPAYQMAVFSEVVIGAGGIGQIGSLTIQFSAITSASGITASGQVGSLVSDVIVPLTGVSGIGHPGIPTLSGAKRIKRSGRGADNKNFKPELFSKREEQETDAEAMARWRRIVDELLELPPRQGEGTEQPEPDRPVEPPKDFSFLNKLPKPKADEVDPVIEKAQPNWQAIAMADDALLLGESSSSPEADDLLLLGDWL